MNTAVGLRKTRHPLVRGSTDGAPVADSAPLLDSDRTEKERRQLLPGSGGLRFAVLPAWPIEAHDSTEGEQDSASGELILVPLQWPSISVRFNLRTPRHVEGPTGDFVQFGKVCVDFSTQDAIRDDSPVCLTSMEFKTLKFFVANPYRVISRDELLNEVWGYDAYPCTRTVDNRILRLRQKLEVDSANPRHFLTVYGAGYKFVP